MANGDQTNTASSGKTVGLAPWSSVLSSVLGWYPPLNYTLDVLTPRTVTTTLTKTSILVITRPGPHYYPLHELVPMETGLEVAPMSNDDTSTWALSKLIIPTNPAGLDWLRACINELSFWVEPRRMAVRLS